MPLPPLATARLLLRERNADDVPAILAMATDPDFMRFVGDGRVPDPVEQEKRIRARIGTDFGMGLGCWSVFPRDRPDDYIGYVVLSPVPGFGDIELSYGIRRDCWGQGFATEAAGAGLEFGFRVRALGEIVALAYADNLRSQRVIAKLGFMPAGLRKVYGQDLLFYRLGREPYLTRVGAPN